MIRQATWCCDQDVHTFPQASLLRLLAFSAYDGGANQPGSTAKEFLQHGGNLLAQLAGRRKDDREQPRIPVDLGLLARPVLVMAQGRDTVNDRE